MNFFKHFFQKPQDHFKKLAVADSQWTVLTWNWDLQSESDRRATLELNGEEQVRVIWSKSEVTFTHNDSVKAYPHKNDKALIDLFNLARHLSVKESLKSHEEFMRQTSEGDIANETRALQWIQASFTTLAGALKKVGNDPDLILTCSFFSGVSPQLSQRVLRLICFNLDINYFMLEDGSLRIVVFDDKGQGHGSQQQPSFHQIIKLTKPLFYDEMIKLLQQVTSVG